MKNILQALASVASSCEGLPPSRTRESYWHPESRFIPMRAFEPEGCLTWSVDQTWGHAGFLESARQGANLMEELPPGLWFNQILQRDEGGEMAQMLAIKHPLHAGLEPKSMAKKVEGKMRPLQVEELLGMWRKTFNGAHFQEDCYNPVLPLNKQILLNRNSFHHLGRVTFGHRTFGVLSFQDLPLNPSNWQAQALLEALEHQVHSPWIWSMNVTRTKKGFKIMPIWVTWSDHATDPSQLGLAVEAFKSIATELDFVPQEEKGLAKNLLLASLPLGLTLAEDHPQRIRRWFEAPELPQNLLPNSFAALPTGLALEPELGRQPDLTAASGFFPKLIENFHGRFGGLTLREHRLQTNQVPFSDWMVYDTYNPKTRTYINTDGTQAFAWEGIPHSFTGEQGATAIEGFWNNQLPEATVVQFFLLADPWLDPVLEDFQSKKTGEGIVREASQQLQHFMAQGTEGVEAMQGIPVRNHRLFVFVKMKQDAIKEARTNLKSLRLALFENLKSAQLQPRDLEPGTFLNLMRRLMQGGWQGDGTRYNPSTPLRKQILLAGDPLDRMGLDQLQKGERHFACLTPKMGPEKVTLLRTNKILGGIEGIVSDSGQISTPFFYSVNLVCANYKDHINSKTGFISSMGAPGSRKQNLAKEQHGWAEAATKANDGEPYVRMMPILWLWDKSLDKLESSVGRAKALMENQTYQIQRDKGIVIPLFMTALPMGLILKKATLDVMERDLLLPASIAVRMQPTQSDFMGNGNAGMLFIGRKGQLVTLNIFDPSANNYNFYVVAGSGAGKSFFANYMLLNLYSMGCDLRIIDVGRSYERLCKMLGGTFVEFGPSSKVCLNPFDQVTASDDDGILGSVKKIAEILATMCFPKAKLEEIAQRDILLLNQGCLWAWKEAGHDACIDLVQDWLGTLEDHIKEDKTLEDYLVKKGHREDMAKRAYQLAEYLNPWTSRGEYGRYFNGKSTMQISQDRMVVLELDDLKEQKDLFQVVISVILGAFSTDLYLSDRSRYKVILVDEAWQFMRGGSVIAEQIIRGYRMARKYGGAFGVITQSPMDMELFGEAGKVILANATFKFHMMSQDYEKAVKHQVLDADPFSLQMMKSVATNRPHYSEIYVESQTGKGIMRLTLNRFLYYLFTTDSKEVKKIDDMARQHQGDYTQAIKALVELES